MYGSLLYYTLGLILFVNNFSICSADKDEQDASAKPKDDLGEDDQEPPVFVDPSKHISIYEFGEHTDGEEASFAVKSTIPNLRQVYALNVTPPRQELDKRFTYLRVEYLSPLSKVDVKYDPERSVLIFLIRFPLIHIPFGIVGYSLKAKVKDKVKLDSRSWRKCNKYIQRRL